MNVTPSHRRLLERALSMIDAGDPTPTANADRLAAELGLDAATVQEHLAALAVLFNTVFRGDDRIISVADPKPEAREAASAP